MKQLINLIIILSLSAKVCYAQQAERVKENKGVRIESMKEYKVIHDSIAALVKQAKKDSINYVGMAFSEFEKQLDKRGLKITIAAIAGCDCQRVYPQHVYGIRIWFATDEVEKFAGTNDLRQPYIIVDFTESKPYEKALSLIREYKGHYNEEVAAFYADAVIKSLFFHYPDDIYLLKHRRPVDQQ